MPNDNCNSFVWSDRIMILFELPLFRQDGWKMLSFNSQVNSRILRMSLLLESHTQASTPSHPPHCSKALPDAPLSPSIHSRTTKQSQASKLNSVYIHTPRVSPKKSNKVSKKAPTSRTHSTFI